MTTSLRSRFRSITTPTSTPRSRRAIRPCLPNCSHEIAGEPSPDDSTDSERDEASEEEIHDVALAVETSSYSPQGHEVTSPPSENDQGDGIRIVTEAVEQPAPKRASGASASNSRSDRAAENAGGRSEDDS